MDPDDWVSNPAIQRRSVVFPQPEGPKKQANSPSLISIDIFFNAWNAPKCLQRSITDK